MLYQQESASDVGMLYHLRNIFNRRNVKNDPKNDMNAAEDFLEVVTDAIIIHGVSVLYGTEDGETFPQQVIDMISSYTQQKNGNPISMSYLQE